MNRINGMNSTSKRFIFGRMVVLAMLVTAFVTREAGPLVYSAGAQQPGLPTVFIIGDSTVKTPTQGQQG